jgi:hypothetical protein
MESIAGAAAEAGWDSYRVIVTKGELIKVDICRREVALMNLAGRERVSVAGVRRWLRCLTVFTDDFGILKVGVNVLIGDLRCQIAKGSQHKTRKVFSFHFK